MRVRIEGKKLPEHSLFSVDLKDPANISVTGEAVSIQDRITVRSILSDLHENDCIKFAAEDLDLEEQKGIGQLSSIALHEGLDSRHFSGSAYTFRLKKLQ
jgi:hypothetical protein